MDRSDPIVFYDIASAPPATCFAPNPWKTRYALNFKGVHYRTEWIELPEVKSVREKLGVAPNRTLPDGSPLYTLPIIHDPSTKEIVGDSFEIALYLDKTYPDGPTLLPPSTTALQAAFNAHVDDIFTSFVILCLEGLPLNPKTAEASRATFAKRAGKETWEELTVAGEERTKIVAAFKEALGKLAKCYKYGDGPFLEGQNASYADLIVGGWLAYVKATVKEWDEVQSWHNGRWGKIRQALDKYATVT